MVAPPPNWVMESSVLSSEPEPILRSLAVISGTIIKLIKVSTASARCLIRWPSAATASGLNASDASRSRVMPGYAAIMARAASTREDRLTIEQDFLLSAAVEQTKPYTHPLADH